MRQFFLFLLLCWVAGIASGQWLSLAVSLAITFLISLLMWRHHLRFQLSVAGIALLMIGNLYGQPIISDTTECTSSLPFQGRIAGAPRLQTQRAQYTLLAPAGCRLLVTAARFPSWREGEEISIEKGKFQPVAAIENEGYATYLRRQGIHATVSYPTIRRVQETRGTPRLSERVYQVIQTIFVEPDAGVVSALLLANTDTLPETLQENFRATGLSHLLAISGMNISLLAGILIVLLQLLPLSPLSRTITISVILWGYMALIGWPISAVRATFFWTIALVALRLHLLVSLPTVLLLTLLLMVSLQPLLMTDISFQLSVAAVTGIFILLFMTKRIMRTLPVLAKWFVASIIVTAGATLTTWPIIAYHFGTVSLISIPANLVVAPVVAIQMVTAITTVLVGLVSPAVALLPAYIFHLTVVWMDIVSTLLASITWTYLQEITLPRGTLAGYYAALAGACYWWLRYQKRSWRELWQ